MNETKVGKAPTSKIVQIKEHNQVLCEDGSVWIVKHWKGKGDKKHKNEWECLIEPFNGKQYEFVEKIRLLFDKAKA